MGFSANGVQATRGGSNERRVIASYWMSGTNVKVYDDVTTTVTTYGGMNEANAVSKCADLKANTMTDYKIRSSSSAGYSWILCPLAKGTITNATYARDGNSRMFTVTATTETHTCSNSASWEEYTT